MKARSCSYIFMQTCSHVLLTVVLCISIGLISGCSRDDADFAEASTVKTVAQALEDAEFAITERNFRINNRLHIGKAIGERGANGFPDYEVILFCNLSHAKRMLELAPDFIRYCPFRLAIRDDGQDRIITASLLPQDTPNRSLNDVTREINALVKEIVEFAAKEWPALDDTIIVQPAGTNTVKQEGN